jgi:hypothetical protein
VGVGAGPSAGWTSGQPSVLALHLRGRGWWRVASSEWNVSVEPTRFLGSWFTDCSGGGTMERGRVIASFSVAERVSPAYGSKAAASGLLQFFATPTVAFELGGGNYLPEPYQGFPQGRYVTAGVRIHVRPHAPVPSVASPLSSLTTLRGDSLVVHVRLRAATLAIAGDWNGWTPVLLRSLGSERWEAALQLRTGTYHFALVVNGHEWVVPHGVTTVSDELGGKVGVLVVE